MTPPRPRPARGAFTLVEVLVVLAVIALLSALAWPVLSAAVAKSHSARCVGNLRALGVALNLYLADHNNVMPALAAGRASKSDDLPVIDTALAPYVNDAQVFHCPADNRVAALSGTSYFYNSALGGQTVANMNFLLVESVSRIPVLVDKEGWHRVNPTRVNHLFADGHASEQLRLFAE